MEMLNSLFDMTTSSFVGVIITILVIIFIIFWLWLFVNMLTSTRIKGSIKGIWFILFFAFPISALVWLIVRKK